MAETIESRLQLLAGSNQISPKVTTVTQQLIGAVEAYLAAPLSGEAAIAFITHLALGLERLRNDTPLENALPDELLAEVQGRTADWQFAQTLAQQAEDQLNTPLPESEIGYIAAHIGALSESLKSQGDTE